MIRAFTHNQRLSRFRTVALALVGLLVASACDNNSEPATDIASESPAPAAAPDSVATVDSVYPDLALATTSGISFGPFNLWNSYTTVSWGPTPFSGSHSYVDAGGIVTFINAARLKKQRLVLAMTGGPSTKYTTNGRFDLTKWRNRMNTFNTSSIRNAVAAGVSDGTIIGNSLIDEPETKRWGGVLTKPMLDGMASYARNIFPSLPMGVNHGATGYTWRTSERYTKVDYTLNNFVWWITRGDAYKWRDAVLAQNRRDGVNTAFSLNILGGGVQDKDNTYNCTGSGQAGKGPYYPTCRMTSDQVKNWGKILGPSGCMLMMWTFDDLYMSKSANVTAFKEVASVLASKARRSCKRA